jgi:hypothetical protein
MFVVAVLISMNSGAQIPEEQFIIVTRKAFSSCLEVVKLFSLM